MKEILLNKWCVQDRWQNASNYAASNQYERNWREIVEILTKTIFISHFQSYLMILINSVDEIFA
jgi:hypothetical protein